MIGSCGRMARQMWCNRYIRGLVWGLMGCCAAATGMWAMADKVASARDREFPVPTDISGRLVIQSTTDYMVIAPVIEAFQERWPGILITYNEITTNELNAAVEQACAQDRFIGDLIISSSIDQQLKLVNDGCAQSPGPNVGGNLPDWAKWRDELFGLTYEPAVTVYNKAFFANRPPPQSRFDLIDLLRESDTFRAKVGSYDIETSGVGYLFAFQDAIQASTWGRLVEGLGRNEAQLFCCTGEILDRVADGRLLLGYNVLGSYALSRIGRDDRVGIVLPSDYTLIMSRAAFISRNAERPGLARAFIDFMLSPSGRAILSRDAGLLSPIDGPARLARLVGRTPNTDPQELRPIALTPALLVGLDQAKRNIFLQQWRAALPPRQLSKHP